MPVQSRSRGRLRPWAWAAVALAALGGVAGCDGTAEPTPTPTPRPVVTRIVTPEPTPSPTPPVAAEYNPDWTENQLAAVQTVDAFVHVWIGIASDPVSADLSALLAVTDEPLYTVFANLATQMANVGNHAVFPDDWPVGMSVAWYVYPEENVDGRLEIRVERCAITGGSVVDSTGATVPAEVVAPPRAYYGYTVQQVPDLGWRVVYMDGGNESC